MRVQPHRTAGLDRDVTGRSIAAPPRGPRVGSSLDPSLQEHGFSLVEAMVAAVVAVIAVLGLAYSFSAGRGLIDRYAAARDALEAAQGRLDRMTVQAARDPATADLTTGVHGPFPRTLNANLTGMEKWTVAWANDEVDNFGGSDDSPNDYKRVTVEITWQHGGIQDKVQLTRTFLGP